MLALDNQGNEIAYPKLAVADPRAMKAQESLK